jgi:transposase
MLLDIKGIGPEFAAILWSEGLFRHFDNRLPGQDERDFGSSFATLAQQQQAASL